MTADITDIDEAGLIRPVERPVPLRQSVYEALVELVVEGRLRPGGEDGEEGDRVHQAGIGSTQRGKRRPDRSPCAPLVGRDHQVRAADRNQTAVG